MIQSDIKHVALRGGTRRMTYRTYPAITACGGLKRSPRRGRESVEAEVLEDIVGVVDYNPRRSN